MPNTLLTDRAVRALRPRANRQIEIFDRKIVGLTLRVSAKGAKTFYLIYRVRGINRRLKLGRYPTLSLADARQLAREALNQVDRGRDPSAERGRTKQGYESGLYATVLEEFVDKHCERNTRSAHETEQTLKREFGKLWAKLPLQQITKRKINDALDAIVDRGTLSAANHAFAALRKLFNWAVERGYLEQSPCSGMKAPARIASRERVLSDDELVAIFLASEKLGYPFGPLVLLLILTGQRRAEVGGMRWQELDLANSVWELPPGSRSRVHKSARRHTIPLASQTVELLRSLPHIHTELIFPARGSNRPVSGYSKWKRRLDELSGVQNWTLHDLRRTAATGMAGLGVAPHVIERILNHRTGTLGGVAGIYNRFAYLPEMSEALERWATHVESLLRSDTSDERILETPMNGKAPVR